MTVRSHRGSLGIGAPPAASVLLRQYEHIKESYRDKGVSAGEAKERAARTVRRLVATRSGAQY